MSTVPDIRMRTPGDAPVRPDRAFVLYWMQAYRRVDANFALERAVEWARRLGRPLVVLEELRAGEPWASDRFHRFALDGMAERARRLEDARVLYHPYVEPGAGDGDGLVEALAGRACVVVTDDYPAFTVPGRVAAAGALDVRLEAVDSNGLLPLRAGERAWTRAYDFRRHLQRTLPDHLAEFPAPHPLSGYPLPAPGALPEDILRRWPAVDEALLAGRDGSLVAVGIDHDVPPVAYRGGRRAARRRLEAFLNGDLGPYAGERNDPGADAASGLSPYLRAGHLSAHEIFRALVEREDWHPGRLAREASGAREGWWGMSEGAEAFLEQLVTWRELGFNGCAYMSEPERYESLPDWARRSLEAHASDERPYLYDRNALEEARTHDPLWNAAQNQLRREGTIHNYMRMLWGKKILEWSPSARHALERALALNDRWAVDGRGPNAVSGVFWCFGRYDRPWGPERPVFGTVRYMTSKSTARKHDVAPYLERYGG